MFCACVQQNVIHATSCQTLNHLATPASSCFQRPENNQKQSKHAVALQVNKQQATSNKQQATSNKQQATSNKQQATSNKQQATSNKQQATSNKQQATSNKQQATSNKQQERKREKTQVYTRWKLVSHALCQTSQLSFQRGHVAAASRRGRCEEFRAKAPFAAFPLSHAKTTPHSTAYGRSTELNSQARRWQKRQAHILRFHILRPGNATGTIHTLIETRL